MRADLKVIGPAAIFPVHIASGGTQVQTGEPLHNLGTFTSGAINTNEAVLAAADTPVIGTHNFRGIANENSLNVTAGTTEEQFLNSAYPVPAVGRIQGRAETAANIDTTAELLAIINDLVLIDYNATGASDGGELYTIQDTASADTSGLQITGGNTSLGRLEVTVHSRAYRNDVS